MSEMSSSNKGYESPSELVARYGIPEGAEATVKAITEDIEMGVVPQEFKVEMGGK
jgi:hypothetical protein